MVTEYIEITDGAMRFDSLLTWKDKLSKLKDGRYIISVQKPVRKRTNKQNSYYWDIVVKTIGDDLGYYQNEMHEILKSLFLKIVYDNGFERVRSTTELTTGEFIDYMQKIRVWASQLGIFVPVPGEEYAVS